MLRYFRINDPYRLAGLLVIMLLMFLPHLISWPEITYPELKSLLVGEKIQDGSALYSEVVDSTAPLAAWFYGFLDMVFGRSLVARHILAFLIIFSQSAYLGIIFINKKAFSENTYIPSLIFSALFAFSFDTLSLTGELIGSGFLLLALNNLFKEIEFRVQREETVFAMGLFIGLASLCSFSYVIFVPGTLVILLVFTRTVGRKFFLFLFGFLLAHGVFMSIYYFNGTFDSAWSCFYLPGLSFQAERFVSWTSLLVLSAIPLGYLIISIVILNRDARFTKYQSQLLQAMFFWMLFSFLMIFYAKDLRPQTMIVLIPALSFFITHLLLLIRRRRFAEINIWIIVIGVVTVSYLARYNKLKSVNYEKLLVRSLPASPQLTNRKVLMLDNDLAIYKVNRLATGFISWSLTKEIAGHPEYYDNVVQLYKAFSKEPPQVIIDPNNVMPAVFDRIPELAKRYRPAPGKAGTYLLQK